MGNPNKRGPKGPHKAAQIAKAILLAQASNGTMTYTEIAQRCGLCAETVGKELRKVGAPRMGRGKPKGPGVKKAQRIERRDLARQLRAEGKTWREVGEALGVSGVRARALACVVYREEAAPSAAASEEMKP